MTTHERSYLMGRTPTTPTQLAALLDAEGIRPDIGRIRARRLFTLAGLHPTNAAIAETARLRRARQALDSATFESATPVRNRYSRSTPYIPPSKTSSTP